MKAAIYTRLSEEDRFKTAIEQDSESIQNQKNMLVTYAVENSWEIYDIYNDDDYKGSDRARPEWNRMLKDAEGKKFDILLCKTQSRFTRELEIVEKYLHCLFPLWGIRFVSVVDNADTDNRGNKKARQINGLVNEWYLEDLSENERAVFKAKQRSGEFIGDYAPYGYQKNPDNHNKLLIDEPAAQVVRRIFQLYSDGWSHVAIAKKLNAGNIPPPYEYKRRMGQPVYKRSKSSSCDGIWKDYTVRMILTRQCYVGDMVQGVSEKISYKSSKTRKLPRASWVIVPNMHEPIVSRALFFQVQEIMRQKSHRPKGEYQAHIFAGKARCGKCGASLVKTQAKGNSYLRCRNRCQTYGSCDNLSIRLDLLEEIVRKELTSYLREYAILEEAERRLELLSRLELKVQSLCQRHTQLLESRDEQSRALASLYLDKARGVVDEAQFQVISQAFLARQQSLDRELVQIKLEEQDLRQRDQLTAGLHELVQKYEEPDSLSHQMVQELIRFVEIRADGEPRCRAEDRQYHITIHWNF